MIKFKKLKVKGFKSFVEPIEIIIENIRIQTLCSYENLYSQNDFSFCIHLIKYSRTVTHTIKTCIHKMVFDSVTIFVNIRIHKVRS